MNILGSVQTRLAQVESVKGDQKTFKASLSSETPVRRFFGNEILIHTQQAINFERAARGLSLLFNHDNDSPIGRVSNIRLEKKRLKGDLVFSNNDRAREILQDVQDGFLGDISIRYQIDNFEEVERDGQDTPDIFITRWTPVEVSLVTVPADSTVGINRMKPELFNTTKPTLATQSPEEAVKLERQRVADITDLFDMPSYREPRYQDLRNKCITEGLTCDQTRKALLDLISSEDQGPIVSRNTPDHELTAFDFRRSGSINRGLVYSNDDQLLDFSQAAEDSLLSRCGIPVDNPHDAARDFMDSTIVDLARIHLEQSGVSCRGWNPGQIINNSMQSRGLVGHASTDFAGLLSNVSEKSLLNGFEIETSQHREFTKLMSLPDFKTASLIALSEMGGLSKVVESGEYTHTTMSDQKTDLAISKYGKLFAITREALINDDLDGLSSIPRKMGQAAGRLESDKVFEQLTSNPVMADGIALFNTATHKNLAGSGTALSVTSLGAGRAAMRVQKGLLNESSLNIVPRFLLVSAAKETLAENILNSILLENTSASGSTGIAESPTNRFIKSLRLIVDPRLDSDSTTAWYLIANPSQIETIVLAHLQGQTQPFIDSRDGWNVDGIEYKVRFEFVAKSVEWRSAYKNPGA